MPKVHSYDKCYSLGCSGQSRSIVRVMTLDEGAVDFKCCKRHETMLIQSAEFSNLKWYRLFMEAS